MAKTKAGKPVYTRWGAPHRTYTTKMFELYRNDPTKGFAYNAQELTSDYLRNLWSTDRLFNDCNPKTFNANFRGWAVRYRAGLERGGIRRAAFERLSDCEFCPCHCFLIHCHCFFLTFIFYLLVVQQRESDSIPASVPANNAGEEDEDDSTFVFADEEDEETLTLETEDSAPAPAPAHEILLSRKVSFTLPL